jgi:hypothetical protein
MIKYILIFFGWLLLLWGVCGSSEGKASVFILISVLGVAVYSSMHPAKEETPFEKRERRAREFAQEEQEEQDKYGQDGYW